MAVSHHDDPATYKTYVINAAHVDPERDAHIGRHFNLYASGYYKPPVALSIPAAIETIKQETSEELEQLKKGQARIMMISDFPWVHKVTMNSCILLMTQALSRTRGTLSFSSSEREAEIRSELWSGRGHHAD